MNVGFVSSWKVPIMSLQFGEQRGALKAVRQLVTNFMHIQWKSLVKFGLRADFL